MQPWSMLGIGILVCAPGAAQAQTNGVWRVDGAIAGRAFVLDCEFNGAGGVCTDAASRGERRHPLISLTSSGDRIAWSFKTKVAIMNITLNFDGRIAANRMSGTMRAAGRSGTFTGVRR